MLKLVGSRHLLDCKGANEAAGVHCFCSVFAAWPFMAAVQQSTPAPVLIGWFSLQSRQAGGHLLEALKEGLSALGWKEGTQFVVEERWANGQVDQPPPLADDLAAMKPAVIVAFPVSR
jgi:hypothetical protein